MATRARKMDVFSNIMTDTLTLSAANTVTFSEINVGLNIFDKVGLLINRIDYELTSGSTGQMTADGDYLVMCLSQSNSLTSITIDQTEIIDSMKWGRHDFGAAASGQTHLHTITKDFSTLPGGGILIPPKPLYFGGDSDGFASAATLAVRIYFTVEKLTGEQYLELLETRRAFG